jgi:hypothetical protein
MMSWWIVVQLIPILEANSEWRRWEASRKLGCWWLSKRRNSASRWPLETLVTSCRAQDVAASWLASSLFRFQLRLDADVDAHQTIPVIMISRLVRWGWTNAFLHAHLRSNAPVIVAARLIEPWPRFRDDRSESAARLDTACQQGGLICRRFPSPSPLTGAMEGNRRHLRAGLTL